MSKLFTFSPIFVLLDPSARAVLHQWSALAESLALIRAYRPLAALRLSFTFANIPPRLVFALLLYLSIHPVSPLVGRPLALFVSDLPARTSLVVVFRSAVVAFATSLFADLCAPTYSPSDTLEYLKQICILFIHLNLTLSGEYWL